MKRSDYKYVYNTLPKFGNSPFEKRTWIIKTGQDWIDQREDICATLSKIIRSGKLLYCTLTNLKAPGNMSNEMYYLKDVDIRTSSCRISFVSGSDQKVFLQNWEPTTDAEPDVYCISYVIF